jgi:hypothetical protein
MMNFWQYANKNNFVICILAFYVTEVKLSGLHGFLDSFNFLVQTYTKLPERAPMFLNQSPFAEKFAIRPLRLDEGAGIKVLRQ